MADITRYDAAEIGRLFNRDDRSFMEKYGQAAGPFFRIEISDQAERVLFSAESNVSDGNYDLDGLIISSVEWDETDCQASSLTMEIQNPDLRLQDSRLFAEGNTVDLWMGYDGLNPDYMGRGIIVEIETTFPRQGMPTLQVTCYDIAHFMMEEGKAEIVPEGTAWFERHTQTTNQNQNRRTRTGSTHIADTEDERRRRSGQRSQGQPVTPGVSIESVGFGVGNLDLGQTPSRNVVLDAENQSQSQQSQSRTTTWRQARLPRRSRRSGRVWREQTDNEIVETIFASYGIIAYTVAINQRVSGRNVEREREETLVQGDWLADTEREQQARRRSARLAGATPAVPDTTVAGVGFGLGVANLDLEQRELRFRGVTRTVSVTERVGGRRIVQKSGTSDWEFIKKLGKARGYITFVFFDIRSRRWIGYWGPPQNVPQNATYTFEYNAGDDTSLGEVKPRLSMRNQKTEIDLSFVDPRSGREQRLRVAMDSVNPYSPEFRGPDGAGTIEEPLGNGPEVVLTIHGQRTAVVANRPFTDMEDARRWLMGFWYRHATDFCQIEGDTLIGLPEMRARQKHTINGIGRISGAFFITKATHRMSTKAFYSAKFSGYRLVDFMFAPPTGESELLTVDSNELGESNPDPESIVIVPVVNE